MGINPRPRSVGDEERGQQRLDGGDGLDQVQGVRADGGAGHKIAAAPAQGEVIKVFIIIKYLMQLL